MIRYIEYLHRAPYALTILAGLVAAVVTALSARRLSKTELLFVWVSLVGLPLGLQELAAGLFADPSEITPVHLFMYDRHVIGRDADYAVDAFWRTVGASAGVLLGWVVVIPAVLLRRRLVRLVRRIGRILMCSFWKHDWRCNQCRHCAATRIGGHNSSADDCEKCTDCGQATGKTHNWSGSCERCLRCGMTREVEHDWSKNCEQCAKCAVGRKDAHDWSKDCERCAKCAVGRRDAHDWSKDRAACNRCGVARSVATLACSGCGTRYEIGRDAIAVSFEFALASHAAYSPVLVLSNAGSTPEREDLVDSLKDVAPENLESARERARQSWRAIEHSLSSGQRRLWCCKECNKVNAYSLQEASSVTERLNSPSLPTSSTAVLPNHGGSPEQEAVGPRFRVVLDHPYPGSLFAIRFECGQCGRTVQVPGGSIIKSGANVKCHSCGHISYVPPNAGKE